MNSRIWIATADKSLCTWLLPHPRTSTRTDTWDLFFSYPDRAATMLGRKQGHSQRLQEWGWRDSARAWQALRPHQGRSCCNKAPQPPWIYLQIIGIPKIFSNISERLKITLANELVVHSWWGIIFMLPFIKWDGYLNQKKNHIYFSKDDFVFAYWSKILLLFNSRSQSSHKKGLISIKRLGRDRMGIKFVSKGEPDKRSLSTEIGSWGMPLHQKQGDQQSRDVFPRREFCARPGNQESWLCFWKRG